MAGRHTEQMAQNKFNELMREKDSFMTDVQVCDAAIDDILDKPYYPKQDRDIDYYTNLRNDADHKIQLIEEEIKELLDMFGYCIDVDSAYINEGVNIVESSSKSKAKRLFSNPSKSKNIRTFAILTANNPNKMTLSREDNHWRNTRLKMELSNNEFSKLEKELTIGAHPYYKVKGMYDNVEQSFLIYNLSLEDAKLISRHNEQQSFIYGRNLGDKLVFEFWANKSKNGYSYYLLDSKDFYYRVDDAENYYTQIARDFKINIPFEKFEWATEDMIDYVDGGDDEVNNRLIDECLSNEVNGKTKYMNRIQLYRRG